MFTALTGNAMSKTDSVALLDESLLQEIQLHLQENTRDTSFHFILKIVQERCKEDISCQLERYSKLIYDMEQAFNLPVAIYLGDEMIKLAGQQKIVKREAEAHFNQYRFYSAIGNYHKAIFHMDIALELYQILGDQYYGTRLKMNKLLGSLEYLSIEEVLPEMNQMLAESIHNYDTINVIYLQGLMIRITFDAEHYNESAHHIAELEKLLTHFSSDKGDAASKMKIIIGKARIAWHNDDLLLAEKYYQKALIICKERPDRWREINVLNSLAEIAWDRGNSAQAKTYLKEANEKAKNLNLHDLLSKNYRLKTTIAEKELRYADAFHFIKKQLYYDSLFKNRSAGFDIRRYYLQSEKENLLMAEEKNELELQIKNIQLRKFQLIFGLILLLLTGLIIGLYKQHKGKKELSSQNKLIHEQAKQLKTLDEAKSRFFANVSHEFRTPLTLIIGPIENMLKTVSDKSLLASLKMMRRNAKQLQKYINEILDLSKLESNKLKLKTRELNVVKYTSFMISSFESTAKRKDITITRSFTSENLSCYLDPDKINSILSNLISNAIKYSPKGSRVDVSVSQCLCNNHESCTQLTFGKNGGCAIISVKDSGMGIPKDKLPFIFDRYFRVEKAQVELELGTGLGLALVRELVHLHRGTINVASEENKYTEFVCRFPMGKKHLRADEIVEGEPYEIEDDSIAGFLPANDEYKEIESENTPDPEKKIILVVDDSDDMRSLIHLGLKNEYKIIEAKDGEEGEKTAIETCPDLIICDVSMPKKEGFEVAKHLKSNEITSHIPIIMLTGRAKMEDKITGLQTGVDDYLIKPFHTKELTTRIDNLLKQREKLKIKYSGANILEIGKLPEKSIDQVFLSKVIYVIEENLADEGFEVQKLINILGISRTQLHRKLKALTNQSATEMIQHIRLTKASEMLKNKTATVSEISYLVGFSSLAYFSRLFKKHFGHSPSKH